MKGLLAINKRNIKELSHMEKEAVHVVKEMGIGNEREKIQFRLVLLWLFKNGLLQGKRLRS